MKKLIITVLLSIAGLTAGASDLSDLKRIECDSTSRKGDHQTITPNIFKSNGKTFAALTGYYHVNNFTDRVDRKVIFYELNISVLDSGATRIKLFNDNTHFQNDFELNLFTKDFISGELQWFVFQPGIAGYGPGGIPQSTFETLVYSCQFIR